MRGVPDTARVTSGHAAIVSRRSFLRGGTLLGISIGLPAALVAYDNHNDGPRPAAANGAVLAQVEPDDWVEEPGGPHAPSNLVAVATSAWQIDLTWTGNWDEATFYQIERSPNGVDAWTVIEAALPAHAEWYSDSELEPGTTYFYRVRAGRVD